MKRTLQISNGIAFGATVFMNYLSNTGLINDTNIGDVSNDLNNTFTPAGYAFAIWGLIYLLLLGFAIYQGRSLWNKQVEEDDFVLKTGWWFVISCIANMSWIFCWLYGYVGLSIIFMLLILISLLKIVVNNRMELWDAPLPIIAFLWWPFVVYSGWIAVATIANFAAYLTKISWSGWGLSDSNWTLIMISVAVVINLWVTWKRNMREFALVGAWALAAIAVANRGMNEVVVTWALISAGLLVASSMVHGIINRKTSPFVKLFNAKKN